MFLFLFYCDLSTLLLEKSPPGGIEGEQSDMMWNTLCGSWERLHVGVFINEYRQSS